MKRIGITGPTGAGKTTALGALEELGACVIDADAVYHRLLEESAPLRTAPGFAASLRPSGGSSLHGIFSPGRSRTLRHLCFLGPSPPFGQPPSDSPLRTAPGDPAPGYSWAASGSATRMRPQYSQTMIFLP